MTEQSATEILESISDAVVAIDLQWRYTYVNTAAEQLMGRRREEILGRTSWETLPALAGTPLDIACRRAMDERVTVHSDEYYVPSGKWFAGTVYSASNGIVVHVQDISDRKRTGEALRNEEVAMAGERERAEQELREVNARITEILESVADAVSACDQNWRYTYVNERAVQLLGKSRDELIGQSIWDLFPEVVGTEVYRKCQQAMAERVPVHFEAYLSDLNRWYENDVYPTKEGLTVYWREITKRKAAEERLRRSETCLAEGQKLSHTGSGSWNVSTGETLWSDETYRIYGFEPGSVRPSYEVFFGIVHPDDRLDLEEMFKNVASERSDYDAGFRIVRPDGMVRHIHSIGHPLFDGSGALTEVIGTVMDITEQKDAAAALRKAQAELAHVSRVSTLGAMITSIVHEISQPLAAIAVDGGASLRWLEREIPKLNEAREAVKRMVDNTMRAVDVINKIRSYGRRNVPKEESLSVNEIVLEVIGLAGNELTANGVAVHTELQPDLPPVRGDRTQLQQVILNLILNSSDAMCAADWPIRELVIRSQESERGEVVVSVQDSGHGLSATDAERIFDPFFSTKTERLGLGLWISRIIVEAHGGRIWAKSSTGKGATLQLALPVLASLD